MQRTDPSHRRAVRPERERGRTSAATRSPPSATPTRIIKSSALDLVFSTAIGGFTLTTFLSALERSELADIQAEPVITTLDNRQADILVGEETPVRVIDALAPPAPAARRARTVQFKETGIRLTVTPHVTNNRQILMDLRTERSAMQTLAAADLGFNFTKQKAENQLLVNDGETAVIGGLTVTEVNRTRSGIPLLGGCRSWASCSAPPPTSERRRDLIILVTPRIIDDGRQPEQSVGARRWTGRTAERRASAVRHGRARLLSARMARYSRGSHASALHHRRRIPRARRSSPSSRGSPPACPSRPSGWTATWRGACRATAGAPG